MDTVETIFAQICGHYRLDKLNLLHFLVERASSNQNNKRSYRQILNIVKLMYHLNQYQGTNLILKLTRDKSLSLGFSSSPDSSSDCRDSCDAGRLALAEENMSSRDG